MRSKKVNFNCRNHRVLVVVTVGLRLRLRRIARVEGIGLLVVAVVVALRLWRK
jgi:hypothetical protein